MVPTVYTEHSTISDWLGEGAIRQRSGLLNAQVISSVSRTSCSNLAAAINSDREVQYIRHIVESVPREDPKLARERGGVSICCTSNMRPEKGIETLVRAAALVLDAHPETRFELAGAGSHKSELESLTRGLGINQNVVFSGTFDNHGLEDVLSRAEIFVLPSLTEGLPVSLLEAMARGDEAAMAESGFRFLPAAWKQI